MKNRIVSLFISMLLVVSSISMSAYAFPDDNEQLTSGEIIEETENTSETNTQESDQPLQDELNGEQVPDYSVTDPTDPFSEQYDAYAPQEELPITIQLNLGKNNSGTLTITGDDAHHDAHLSIRGDDEYASMKLEKNNESGEWSVVKCDTYSGKIQAILRVVIAVMIGCSVSFLGLAIIIKFGRQ